jgi:hypothetical protein
MTTGSSHRSQRWLFSCLCPINLLLFHFHFVILSYFEIQEALLSRSGQLISACSERRLNRECVLIPLHPLTDPEQQMVLASPRVSSVFLCRPVICRRWTDYRPRVLGKQFAVWQFLKPHLEKLRRRWPQIRFAVEALP